MTHKNSQTWGREKARERYDVGGTVRPLPITPGPNAGPASMEKALSGRVQELNNPSGKIRTLPNVDQASRQNYHRSR